MTRDPTVFIVDDDPAARRSVELLVAPMGIATEAFPSAEKLLERIDTHHRGCIITDVRMLGMSGVELQEELIQLQVEMPVIVITAYGDVPMVVRAMKAGAATFLEKPCRDEELWEAIRKALRQDQEHSLQREAEQGIAARLALLTEKEHNVMQLLLQGKAHKVIASRLDISIRTVEVRRSQILKKMNVATLVELSQVVARRQLQIHLT